MIQKQKSIDWNQSAQIFQNSTQSNSSGSRNKHGNNRASCIDALFIGPRGQNIQQLMDLMQSGLQSHAQYRASYPQNGPDHITEDMKQNNEFKIQVEKTRQAHEELLHELASTSTPFHSERYYGHMNWDVSIPSIAGYISSLLYNQNNATFQSSPATTKLEIFCIEKLIEMIGYPQFLNETDATLDMSKINMNFSWGHITCGGTMSNCEAIWAARSVKYIPFTLRFYIQSLEGVSEEKIEKIVVVLADGTSKKLTQTSVWELFNIPNEEAMNLFESVFRILFDNDFTKYQSYQKQLRPFTLGSLGFLQFQQKIEELNEQNPNQKWSKNKIPKIKSFMSYKGHYSFAKAFGLLGMGQKSIQRIQIDLECRFNVKKLEQRLEQCAQSNIPVLSVIGILGSTQSSSVDNITQIHKIQQKLKARGLSFHFHVDGAYGGYFSSMIRNKEPGTICSFSGFIQEQLQNLHLADSVSINPHKTGYVPYACSCILYKDYRLRNNLNYSAPYIFKEVEPNVAIYGIEGSKAGSSAASLYMALKTLPLDRSHHGELLQSTLINTKIFAASLYCIEEISEQYVSKADFPHEFTCLPFNMTYCQRHNAPEQKEAQTQAYRLISSTVTSKIYNLLQDEQIRKFYFQIGPDLNIVCFTLNFMDPVTKKWNKSLNKINQLTKIVTQKTRIHPADKNINQKNLYLSNTIVNQSIGQFFDKFIDRYDLVRDDNEIEFVRCTIMNPMISQYGENKQKHPCSIFVRQLSRTVNQAINQLYQ